MAESLDLAGPLRDAIIADDAVGGVAELLATWQNEPSVHTRRPVPATATTPLILIAPESGVRDEDVINGQRPVAQRDIFVYGEQPRDYRTVEQIAFRLRALFHRRKEILTVPDYHVMNIVVTGPMDAPTDDDQEVARFVTLRVWLQAL